MNESDSWRDAVRQRGFEAEFERTLLDTLDCREDRVPELQRVLTDSRSQGQTFPNHRRFPRTGSPDPPTIEHSVDDTVLVPCILLSWAIEDRLAQFKRETYRDLRALKAHLDGDDNPHGAELYDFLVAGRWSDERPATAVEHLRAGLADAPDELADPEDAHAGFIARKIEAQGLSTSDAINCLKDFEGRSVPFIRTLCLETVPGMSILELGSGTGIFAFCSVLNGASRAIGIELNPITCLLSRRIKQWLTTQEAMGSEAVSILWGDACRFTTAEYLNYPIDEFDLVVVENLSTGQLFEKQIQMVSHVHSAGLLSTVSGRDRAVSPTGSQFVPSSMTTQIELVELESKPDSERFRAGSTHELQEQVTTVLTDTYPYVEFDYATEPSPAVISTVSVEAQSSGTVDAAALFSEIHLGTGEVIQRGSAAFVGSDVHLVFDDPLPVQTGDTVVCRIAYIAGDDPQDIVFEVANTTTDDAEHRWYLGHQRHQENSARFADRSGLDQLRFYEGQQDTAVRYETVVDGTRRTVFTISDDVSC